MSRREAFGERLRRHRERRGIALQTVSQHTKVSAALFAALERGDCSRWPGGVYNRAYVRGYAAAVGLDPDELAGEFCECYDAPAPAERPAGEALRLALEDDQGDRTRRLMGRAFVAILDLTLAVAAASLATLGLQADFWLVLSCALIGYYALVSPILGATPAARVVYRPGRRRLPPAPAERPADEAPMSEVVRSPA